MSARLSTRAVAKPWGVDPLPAPFPPHPGKRIGEIWFEPPPELPQLLAKYIFTSEALSVQVHPTDADAPGEGKEECWLITHAEPGARLAIGFRQPVSSGEMRAAALDGTIEGLLEWHAVVPGDFFYIPAGTVHAIGAGIGLIEVQQNSDTTYRLYDYGRPRELHLGRGIAVASGARYGQEWMRHVAERGDVVLVDGPVFRLERLDGSGRAFHAGRPSLVIPLDRPACVAGEDIAPGACALARAGDAVVPGGRCLVANPV